MVGIFTSRAAVEYARHLDGRQLFKITSGDLPGLLCGFPFRAHTPPRIPAENRRMQESADRDQLSVEALWSLSGSPRGLGGHPPGSHRGAPGVERCGQDHSAPMPRGDTSSGRGADHVRLAGLPPGQSRSSPSPHVSSRLPLRLFSYDRSRPSVHVSGALRRGPRSRGRPDGGGPG